MQKRAENDLSLDRTETEVVESVHLSDNVLQTRSEILQRVMEILGISSFLESIKRVSKPVRAKIIQLLGSDILQESVVKWQQIAEEAEQRAIEAEQLSITDPLTRVHNRRHLEQEAMPRTIGQIERHPEREFCLTIFDIDHLKAINDKFTHSVGDEAIKHAANIVLSLLRQEDDTSVFRTGGDELTSLTEGKPEFVHRLEGKIAEFNEPQSLPYILSISYGLTVLNHASLVEALHIVDMLQGITTPPNKIGVHNPKQPVERPAWDINSEKARQNGERYHADIEVVMRELGINPENKDILNLCESIANTENREVAVLRVFSLCADRKMYIQKRAKQVDVIREQGTNVAVAT